MKVSAARTSRVASAFPSRASTRASTGTKAEDIDPSAKSSRSRLGMRKATKKVSEAPAAPKKLASVMSRTKPRTRLMSVAADITPAALAMRPWLSMGRDSSTYN